MCLPDAPPSFRRAVRALRLLARLQTRLKARSVSPCLMQLLVVIWALFGKKILEPYPGDALCKACTISNWGAATISAWRAPGCAARHENARCRGRVEVPGHARCMWTYGVYVTVCAGCAATHAWRNSTKWHGRLLRLQHGSQPRGHVHVRCCAGAWVDRQRDIFRCDDGVTDQR